MTCSFYDLQHADLHQCSLQIEKLFSQMKAFLMREQIWVAQVQHFNSPDHHSHWKVHRFCLALKHSRARCTCLRTRPLMRPCGMSHQPILQTTLPLVATCIRETDVLKTTQGRYMLYLVRTNFSLFSQSCLSRPLELRLASRLVLPATCVRTFTLAYKMEGHGLVIRRTHLLGSNLATMHLYLTTKVF